MKILSVVALPVLIAFLMPVCASATETVQARASIRKSYPVPKCGLQEQVVLNISFNAREDSVTKAKAVFDERLQKVTALAKQNNVGKFELQSVSYNINTQMMNDGSGIADRVMYYQLNGNAGYQMDNADAAVAMVDQLTKQHIQSSMNVSSYTRQPCDNGQGEN